MRDIRSKCFMKDLLTKAYLYDEQSRIDAYLEAERILSAKLSGRQLMLYSFLLSANLLFNVFPMEAAVKSLLENANAL